MFAVRFGYICRFGSDGYAVLLESLREVLHEQQSRVRQIALHAERALVARHAACEVAGIVVRCAVDVRSVVGDSGAAYMVVKLHSRHLGHGVQHLGNTAHRTGAEDNVHRVIHVRQGIYAGRVVVANVLPYPSGVDSVGIEVTEVGYDRSANLAYACLAYGAHPGIEQIAVAYLLRPECRVARTAHVQVAMEHTAGDLSAIFDICAEAVISTEGLQSSGSRQKFHDGRRRCNVRTAERVNHLAGLQILNEQTDIGGGGNRVAEQDIYATAALHRMRGQSQQTELQTDM